MFVKFNKLFIFILVYIRKTKGNIMKTLIVILIALIPAISFATVPVASNVHISGINHVDATLTGEYDFSDTDNDLESGSTYSWLQYDDIDDLTGTQVGTGETYTVVSADFGKILTFTVTPRDDAAEIGNAVESAATDDIKDYPDNSMSGNSTYTATDRDDFGSFTTNTNNTINVGNGDSLVVWLDFVVNNHVDINVDAGGYFEVKGTLDAHHDASLDIEGDLVVTGDVIVDKDATFIIADGGSMDVSGDLTTGSGAELNIEGDVAIDGNVVIGDNSSIIVDSVAPVGGTLVIGGDLTGGTGTDILGSGDITVGGTVSGIDDSGTQQITVLPIELVTFTATLIENEVKLDWITAVEINNDFFTIERSKDGIVFESLFEISGQGNSNNLITYSNIDYSPFDGISYYRLKQTDYDGKYSLSNIVGVNNSTSILINSKINVFPNPYKIESGILNIQFSNIETEQDFNITVLDIAGKTIYNSTERNINNAFIKTLQLENVMKGTYFVIINSQTEYKVTKLLVN